MNILPVLAISTLPVATAAALTVPPEAPPAAIESAAPADVHSAGFCVLLGDMGQVVDAELAQTSGDPAVDQSAKVLALQLHLSPPYPKPGWIGMRITLSNNGPALTPQGSAPHCSAASDDGVGQDI